MVIAGIAKVKTIGSIEKKSLKSALPAIKKTEKKNQPVMMRKSAITMYAMGERK
jgi:hypothetical protein